MASIPGSEVFCSYKLCAKCLTFRWKRSFCEVGAFDGYRLMCSLANKLGPGPSPCLRCLYEVVAVVGCPSVRCLCELVLAAVCCRGRLPYKLLKVPLRCQSSSGMCLGPVQGVVIPGGYQLST